MTLAAEAGKASQQALLDQVVCSRPQPPVALAVMSRTEQSVAAAIESIFSDKNKIPQPNVTSANLRVAVCRKSCIKIHL